jgi:hypothetical protein
MTTVVALLLDSNLPVFYFSPCLFWVFNGLVRRSTLAGTARKNVVLSPVNVGSGKSGVFTSVNGNEIFLGLNNGTMFYWNMDRSFSRYFFCYKKEIKSLQVIGDRRVLDSVKVFNITSGANITTWEMHSNVSTIRAISNSLLVLSSPAQGILFVDALSGSPTST